MIERIFSDIGVMAVQAMSRDLGDRPVQDRHPKGKTQAPKGEASGRVMDSNVGSAVLPAEIENFLEMPRIVREYRLDEELGKVLIKLYDKNTGEIFREVPQEDVVKLGKKLKRLSGMLLDKKI